MPLGVVGVLSGRTLDCLTYAENKYRQRFCELSELTGGDSHLAHPKANGVVSYLILASEGPRNTYASGERFANRIKQVTRNSRLDYEPQRSCRETGADEIAFVVDGKKNKP